MDGAGSFGGGYVNVPNSTSLNVSTITVEGWIKRSVIGGGVRQEIIGKIQGTGGYELWITSNQLYFSIVDTVIANYAFSGGSLADTNWHHVAATLSASTVTGYIDGVSVFSTGITHTLASNSSPLRIAEHSEDGYLGNWPLSGILDELREIGRAHV